MHVRYLDEEFDTAALVTIVNHVPNQVIKKPKLNNQSATEAVESYD